MLFKKFISDPGISHESQFEEENRKVYFVRFINISISSKRNSHYSFNL